MTWKETFKQTGVHLRNALQGFATGFVTLIIGVTICAVPLKLVYLWGKFLWNLF